MSNLKIGCHLLNLRLPQFSTGVFARFAFGIVITVSRLVRIRVVLRPISITSPSTEPITTQSPTWNGLSSRTVVAPKMFEIVSCAARARARPVIPKPATIVVKSNPRASAMNTNPNITIKNLIMLSAAETTVF